MDWWLLTFFLGAILSLFLPEVPAFFQLFLLLCLAIGFFSHKSLRSSSGLFFGALWLLLQAQLYHIQIPSELLELMHAKHSLFVKGKVLSLQIPPADMSLHNKMINSLKQKAGTTKRFNFQISEVNHHKLVTPIVVRLSWQQATLDIAQGHTLFLKTKLKPAHGLSNIGSFNYLSWLKANNISATGYVINPKVNAALNSKVSETELRTTKLIKTNKAKVSQTKVSQVNKLHVNQVLEAKSTIRQRLFENYQSIAPDHNLTPILMALAFGERSSLTTAHWRILQATGTSHLIAISGLHVGLLASGAFFIVMIIIRVIPVNNPRWQSLNIRYIAIFISLVFATVYAYLAGFSLPTQRALVMLLLYWNSRLLGVKLSAKRLLLVTVFSLIIISPFSLFTVSFWLSFYAVVIIFLSLWRFRFWLNKGSAFTRFVKGLFIIQCALTVMLIPISAIFFQQISLISLAANIFAVPWMSVVSIPCTLLSVLLMPFSEQLAMWLIALSLQSLAWLWQYLTLLSELSYASIPLAWNQQAVLVCAGGMAFTLIYLSPVKLVRSVMKLTAIILTSVLTSSFYPLAHEGNINEYAEEPLVSWQVVFFDVGQGLSVLIKQNGHGILYDTGAAYSSGFNMTEAVILPYLQYIGMEKLDKVILSHSDNDHAGGLAMLEDNIIIDEIISNDTSISKRAVEPCHRGRTFNWQGLTFEVLSPEKLASPISTATPLSLLPFLPKRNQITDIQISNGAKGPKVTKQRNDDSCVLLISDRHGRKVLLTGDISSKIEKQLLTNYPQLKADILQVPHHGSKTSSSQAFIKQLSPQHAIVSAGYLNRWYMPSAQVRQRYQDENILLINSSEVGQVIFTIKEQSISVQSYVDDLRPFWFSH